MTAGGAPQQAGTQRGARGEGSGQEGTPPRTRTRALRRAPEAGELHARHRAGSNWSPRLSGEPPARLQRPPTRKEGCQRSKRKERRKRSQRGNGNGKDEARRSGAGGRAGCRKGGSRKGGAGEPAASEPEQAGCARVRPGPAAGGSRSGAREGRGAGEGAQGSCGSRRGEMGGRGGGGPRDPARTHPPPGQRGVRPPRAWPPLASAQRATSPRPI